MDNDKSIVCDNCGGTDFTTEGGYFYCTECQTQSQEIQERVFEQTEVQVLEKKVKIRRPSVSSQAKLSSWEIYNYIVYGLVQELQTLGADDKFKEIAYHLWLKYLTKLECISENASTPARLGLSYKKRDAEIVYQRKFKRKRKNTSKSSISVSDMDDRMKFVEKRKQRKMMERSEYDTNSTILQSESTSIANQTLSGLTSDDESLVAGHIVYSKSSVKQLLKHMTYYHLQLHLQDVNNEMTCHKISKSFVPKTYFRGPEMLTRAKLYSVLYLAMLLSQQDFQISDMIRYCREGHLSFLEYKHFFPDTVTDDVIDHTIYAAGKKHFPTYTFVRNFTFQLYEYLELRPCDFSPNILMLCRRYCTELNLPDQIYNIAGDYIKETRPFEFRKKLTCIPNYEGRTMGFIIYVLKVLFGFDDVTEYELSKFAHLANKKITEDPENKQPELFNFDDWFNYLEYRKTVLKRVHFPTWYILHPNRDCPLDLYVKFVEHRKEHYDIDEPEELSMKIAKKYLNDINILQEDHTDNLIEFDPSFTPFRSYLAKLQTIENFQVLDQTLNYNVIKDASKHTVEYLIDPHLYLKLINVKKCVYIFDNAHPKHKLQRIHAKLDDFFKNTYEHWEQKWVNDFAAHKMEQLALDQLMTKILDKHVHNVESGTKFEGTKPEVLYPEEDEHTKKLRAAIGRDKKGRFCRKNDPKALPPEEIIPKNKGKWYVSSWNRTALQNEHNPTLLYQIKLEEEQRNKKFDKMQTASSENKLLNPESKYKYHYIPRMEYCSNIRDVSRMTIDQYNEFAATLPKNFQWLLAECARVLEQSTKELYQEFVNVEVYMNYVYFKKMPVPSKPLSNSKMICKIKKSVEENW